MKTTTYIGIALDDGVFRVDTRRAGQVPANTSFSADERGIELLQRHIASLGEPVRLAIVAGVATLGLALALGDRPEREVFLVSPLIADQPAALASFAAHSV